MKLKNYLASAFLSASLVVMPVSGLAMAQAASVDKAPYQVALHHMNANGVVVKKHHRLRNAALLIGGGLVAKHMWKKHKMRKAAMVH